MPRRVLTRAASHKEQVGHLDVYNDSAMRFAVVMISELPELRHDNHQRNVRGHSQGSEEGRSG